MTMQAQQRPCKACGKPFSAYTERCPHCGKDDKHGSQLGGVVITLVILIVVLPATLIGLVLFVM
jgi:uncharacterized OB-fold protein